MNTFVNMPPNSKVWVYQATNELSDEAISKIKKESLLFFNQWTSHGSNMNAVLEVLHKRFVLIAVDEQTAPASGCGIDKLNHFIQRLEKDLVISLLDRMQVAYKVGDAVNMCSLQAFEQLINTGQVDENTIVFNNLVVNISELLSSWEVPLKQSWHSKMLAS